MENGTIFRVMSPFETLHLVEIEHKFYDTKTGELTAKNLQGYVKQETNNNLFVLDDEEFEEAIKAWSESSRAAARQSRSHEGVQNVSGSLAQRKIKDGLWEATADKTRSGLQEFRDTKSGKRFTVQID